MPQGRERKARLRARIVPSIFVSSRSTVVAGTENSRTGAFATTGILKLRALPGRWPAVGSFANRIRLPA